MTSKTTNSGAKAAYNRPALTVYGSVRNLTGGSVGATMADATSMMAMSDPCTKQNVAQVGEHPAGFGLYLFDYKPEFAAAGEGRQFGVMADEVAMVAPDAVIVGDDGIMRVDYAKLGITRH